MIADCPPHQVPDLSKIQNKQIWKADGMPFLALWETNWDCGFTTEWWHCIKDDSFDVSLEKKNIRYEIRKGEKYFEVKHLEKPSTYKEDLYAVQVAAFSAYSESNRPTVNHDSFIKSVAAWDNRDIVIYGAFFRESQQLCGYCYIRKEGDCNYAFRVQKTNPDYEKYGVNAALVNHLLLVMNERLKDGENYIDDGARAIFHITHFQDYLEKYFKFRKAYCRLHIAINPKYYIPLMAAYRLRKIFTHLDNIGIIHKLNSGLKVIEIANGCDKIFSQQKKCT